MHLRHYGALALLAAPGLGLAQTTTPSEPTLPDGPALLKEGVKLHDAEKYDEAAARYQLITPGDSAYAGAQTELALSLSAARKYQESLAAGLRARALDPFEPNLYNTLASNYEALKQPAAAHQAYVDGLKLYPYNESLWINQGIFELSEKNTAAALASVQRAIELRPAKPSGHRLLGLLAAQQGQVSHAMLSWVMYLAIEPNGANSHNMLVNLERLSQGVPVIDKEDAVAPVSPNAAFEELDQLLTSKVALNSDYTTKVKFKAAIVKQLQLLVEKFPLDADPASDFWLRAYGPVIRVLRQDDNLVTFSYLILNSADDKGAQQWINSNKSRYNKLVEAIAVPLLSLRDQQPLPGNTGRAAAWFGGAKLDGLGAGQRDAKGELQPTGDWLIVDDAGYVSQRGTFSATGKRTGKWTRTRPDGTLLAEQNYANGDREGTSRFYYPSGQLRSEGTYHADKLEGDSKNYEEDGGVSTLRRFKEDKFDGEALNYAANGTVTFRAAMRAGKRDGVLEDYYPDGTLKQHGTYADDKAQGELLSYYPDKTPQRKVVYAQDELNGPSTSYHPNGKPHETGQYTQGKRTGTWHSYFANGQPDTEASYDAAGELHGTYQDYDEQGRHLATSTYEHGRLVRIVSFDATGKTLADLPLKKGRTPAKIYDAEGHVKRTGDMENGHLVGEWKTYFTDGTVREINHYDAKGDEMGTNELYFNNGQLRQRRHYAPGGAAEGYFEQYYPDGHLRQTGFQRNGNDESVWKAYYPTGQLSEEHELFRDELSGPLRSYTPGGKLTEERLYQYGKLLQLTAYDSTGKVVDHYELKPTTKEIVLHYAGSSGKVLNRAGVRAYHYEGASTWLRPDGQPESVVAMQDGKRAGKFRSQYPSGQTEAEYNYLDGKRYGQYRAYYPDGTISSQGRYLDGEQVGEWTYNFPNGKPDRVLTYNDEGDLDGPSRYYNPAGELLLEEYYERERLVAYAAPTAQNTAGPRQALPPAGGPIKTSFANGKPASDQTYAHDYPAATATYYYASGQPFQTVSYLKGVRSGPRVSYWPSGKLLEEENYLHGERHGRCRYYRPDGTLEREETYRAGEQAGPSTTFDAKGQKLRTVYYWNNVVYNPQ